MKTRAHTHSKISQVVVGLKLPHKELRLSFASCATNLRIPQDAKPQESRTTQEPILLFPTHYLSKNALCFWFSSQIKRLLRVAIIL
jgi:hypothetical protein